MFYSRECKPKTCEQANGNRPIVQSSPWTDELLSPTTTSPSSPVISTYQMRKVKQLAQDPMCLYSRADASTQARTQFSNLKTSLKTGPKFKYPLLFMHVRASDTEYIHTIQESPA